MYDDIINVTDSASITLKNTISTNVTNTPLTNSDKRVRYKMDYYILRTFLLVTMLLLMIAINCYHFAKHRSKQENVDALAI